MGAGHFGNVISKDPRIKEIKLLSTVIPCFGYGLGYGRGKLFGTDELNGYGVDFGLGYGFGYGYGFVPNEFKYQVVIGTSNLDNGTYSAKFILSTGNPTQSAFESLASSFTISRVGLIPGVEKYLVTLSSVEANKDKTGAVSPWVVIVDQPVTFDLLELANQGIPGFLGDALAESGTYNIIRMFVDSAVIKLIGDAQLYPAQAPSGMIQIVTCYKPDGGLQIGKCFEVLPGQLTRLLLDLDSRTSLTEAPPGSRNFIFKPELKLTVLVEAGVPLTLGGTVLPRVSITGISDHDGSSEPFSSSVGLGSSDGTSGNGGRGPSFEIEGQSEGTIGIFFADTSLDAPTATVEGRVLLQGRGDLDNAGTEVTLFQGGIPLGPTFITPTDGFFTFSLATGDYQLHAARAGLLAQTRVFGVDTLGLTFNIGNIVLPAGDADADGDVDSRDHQLFQRGLGLPPQPGTYTDPNNNGRGDIVDLSYAGRNLGQVADAIPVP